MKKVALLFGGYSQESVVSVKSAKTVEDNLKGVDLYKIEITKDKWECTYRDLIAEVDKNDFSIVMNGEKIKFDYAFIMIHGTPGEDGKLASYFDMINVRSFSCHPTYASPLW